MIMKKSYNTCLRPSTPTKIFFAPHKVEGDDYPNTILELPIGKIPQNGG